MPKFNVRVSVLARFEYTVEIDVPVEDEARAEAEACSSTNYAEHSPEDFQVARDYCSFEFETAQLTANCPCCGVEHPLPTDDTPFCHCGVFGGPPHLAIGATPGRTDGVCTLPPWGLEDQYHCAACDLAITAEYAAAFPPEKEAAQ